MPYNSLTTRSDVLPTIPEEVSNQLLTNLEYQSAAMGLFTRIPMSTHLVRMPVLSALPVAYFVEADAGLKQTTRMAWANKFLQVSELACLAPVPENVLDDMSFSLWNSLRPLAEQAIARALDAAIFFGTNKPSIWPDALVPSAVAHGFTRVRGTATKADGGLAEDLNQTFAFVEDSGYDVSGLVAHRPFRKYLRAVRDTTGQRLADFQGRTYDGVDLRFSMPGLWPTGSGAAEVVVGDYSQGLIGTRSDISIKLLDQATLVNEEGQVVYSLAQQDLVALRITFRCAFQVSNTITYQQETEADRYPFAVLTAA